MAEDQGYVIKKVGFTISPPLRVCHHQHPSWCLPQAQIVLINCVYCMFDWSETEAGFQIFSSLVSTYVVCERLSVMHGPAGVVEILVQILPEYPLFWSTVSEYPLPKMKIVRESKSEHFRIPPSQKWKLSESPNLSISEYPPPKNENCQRAQIREFQNTPLLKMKIVRESKSESFRIPPSWKWKLSESPNPRVSEYPPWNENCQRVQIWEFQNTPPTPPPENENCQRVQIWEFQNTLPKNENCQRVQIWEFQNNPPPPKMKIVRESKSESFRIPPSPKSEKLQISNFRIV